MFGWHLSSDKGILGPVKIPRLVGATEIADHLGVSRQRVQQLSHDPGFPEPVERLRMGNVWTLDDVRAWAERTGRDFIESPTS